MANGRATKRSQLSKIDPNLLFVSIFPRSRAGGRKAVFADVTRSLFREHCQLRGVQLLERGGNLSLHSTSAHVIVVGVATWSLIDLRILDALLERVALSDVAAFDIDSCVSEEELKQFIPGVPVFTQTPVIVEYQSGQLLKLEQGPEGCELWLAHHPAS